MGDRAGESHELVTRIEGELDVERQGHNLLDTPGYNPQQQPTTASDRSTAFLDGLRGLAAFCVFCQHYVGSFDFNAHEHGFGENGHYHLASLPFIRLFYNGGSAAVSIFFVLSGYVLSKSPVRMLRNGKRQACGVSLLSAVVRRPFRLYLPCFAVTLTVALLMHAPFDLMPEMPWCKRQENIPAEIWNWFFKTLKFFQPFQHHGSDREWYPYNLVIWTIPLELKGSILVYALTAFYGFSGITTSWALAMMSVAVIFLLQVGSWSGACFIAGEMLAIIDLHALDVSFLSRHFTIRKQVLITHVIFIVGYYLLCQPAVAGKIEWALETPGYRFLTRWRPAVYDTSEYYRFWQSYGAMLVVYASLRLQWLQKFLGSRPMRYLGKVSFVLYLVHLPFFYSVADRLGRVFGHTMYGGVPLWYDNLLYVPGWGPEGMTLRFFVCISIMLALCLVLADFGTRFIDVPSVNFGKRLARKLGLEAQQDTRKDGVNGSARLPEHSSRASMSHQ